jgi:hypothetical protein
MSKFCDFIIIKKLGEGSFGRVMKGNHLKSVRRLSDSKEYALK